MLIEISMKQTQFAGVPKSSIEKILIYYITWDGASIVDKVGQRLAYAIDPNNCKNQAYNSRYTSTNYFQSYVSSTKPLSLNRQMPIL